MSDEPSRTVGGRLRAAREARGMSIADVAEGTRIRGSLVRDIESDDFSHCGGMVYARGHVRLIAAAVGLDPHDLAVQFDHEQGRSAPELVTNPLPAYEPTKGLGQSDRPGGSWLTAMVAAAAVVACLVVVSFVLGLMENSRQSTQAKPSPSAKPPATSATPRPSGSPGAVAAVPRSGVNLRLRVASGATWVRVTNSLGAELYQGVLTTGAVRDFRDDKLLTIKYGNSQAVNVVLNGKDLGSPSCGNMVCTQKYEPELAAG